MPRIVYLIILMAMLPALTMAGGRGTTGANFLKIGLGAAAVGQGEAATADQGAISSAFYNPASLAGLTRQTFSATHLNWIEGMQYEALSYGQSMVGLGTIGASLLFLHMPPIETVDANGDNDTVVQVYDLGAQVTLARHLLDWTGIKNLYAGASMKGLYRELAGFQAYGGALDLGCLYEVDQALTLGLSALNLGYLTGFDSDQEALPITLRLGGAYEQPITEQQRVILTVDVVQPFDNTIRANVGLTYNYHDQIRLRGGYKLGYDTDYVQFGAGVTWQMVTVDYAMKLMEVFGPTHYVSASVSFGVSQQALREQKAYQLLDEAEALYADSSYEAALAIVNQAVLIAPKNQEVLLLKNKLTTVLQMLNLPTAVDGQASSEDEPEAPSLRPGKKLTPDQAEELGMTVD